MNLLLKLLVPAVLLAGGIAARNALVATGPQAESQEPQAYVPVVEVLELQPADLALQVRATGEVRPARAAQLAAEVAGRVLETGPGLEVGAFFAADEVLLRIDDRDARIAVQAAEAQLAQAQAALELEEAQGEIARRDWEELGRGDAPPAALRIPQRRAAAAVVAAATVALEKAALDLERCTLRAPFAGRTVRRMVEAGSWTAPGAPLAEVYGTAAAEVVLPLPLDELAHLPLDVDGAPGEAVPVELSAEVGGVVRRWSGAIRRVEGALDPRDRMLRAVVVVDAPYRGAGAALLPGMYVQATLEGRRAAAVYALPRAAVRAGDHVLLVDADDRIHERAVEVVQRDAEQVLATGLAPGDRLCLTPMAIVIEGMQVRVAGATPAAAADAAGSGR